MKLSCNEIYDALIDMGLSEEQIKVEIKKKENDYQGYISKEGCLFLVAKDHNLVIEQELYTEFEKEIDYDEFVIPVSEIHENMTNIVLLGKISKIIGINTFIHKDGTPGKVGSFIINDGTAEIKVVLWDDHTQILENKYFRIGEILRVLNGYCKKNQNETLEIHISKKGKVILSPDNIDCGRFPLLEGFNLSDIKDKRKLTLKDLKGKQGFISSIAGRILKIEEFSEKKSKYNQITFFLKFILEDETSSIPVIVWDMQAIKCLKLLEKNISLRLINIIVTINNYTKEKEIHFTKRTEITII
ncbi:MAG: hypothetical protein EU532_04745 [Promethearchaeota archaeon]|nr:MAG: hypothetical protein EU532_04745 [Candidatus Lokiarchaeota archaeon]